MKRRDAFTMIELLVVVAVIAVLAAIAVPNFLEAQVRSKISRTMQDLSTVRAAVQAYYADAQRYPPNRPAIAAHLQWCARDENIGPWDVEHLQDDYGGQTDFGGLGMGFDGDLFAPQPTPAEAPPAAADSASPRTFDDYRREATANAVGGFPHPYSGYSLTLLGTSGYDLHALTTPVAYYGVALRVDTFADVRDTPLVYIDLYDLASEASPRIAPFLRVARFYLMSYGPDADQDSGFGNSPREALGDMLNPVSGPFIDYDPTNGTVSHGDVFLWGGPRGGADSPAAPAGPGVAAGSP